MTDCLACRIARVGRARQAGGDLLARQSVELMTPARENLSPRRSIPLPVVSVEPSAARQLMNAVAPASDRL